MGNTKSCFKAKSSVATDGDNYLPGVPDPVSPANVVSSDDNTLPQEESEEIRKLKEQIVQLRAENYEKVAKLEREKTEEAEKREEVERENVELKEKEAQRVKEEPESLSSTPTYETTADGSKVLCYTSKSLKIQYPPIGWGGCGQVMKAYDGDKQVAVKIFYPRNNRDNDRSVEREIEFLIKHKHQHIVTFIGVIRDQPLVYSGYVMEFMALGSMHDELHETKGQMYTMKQVFLWITQICEGLQYLHEKHMIHRDLKPHNILLWKRNHLKLADFGLVREISANNSRTKGQIGTDDYTAPEVLLTSDYKYPADVYSLGITIWEIFHRQRPHEQLKFVTDPSGNSAERRVELDIDPDEMDERMSSLIQRCWRNVDERPKVMDIHTLFKEKKNQIERYYTERGDMNSTANEESMVDQRSRQRRIVLYDFHLPIIVISYPYYWNREEIYNEMMLRKVRLLQGHPTGGPSGHYFRAVTKTFGPVFIRYGYRSSYNEVKQSYKKLGVPVNLFDQYVSLRKRSSREIIFDSQLDHPNIAKIIAFTSPTGRRKDIEGFVMEGKPDRILRDYAKEHPLADADVKKLGLQLASALAYYHAQGVVHGRVDPPNILVYDGGKTVKLPVFSHTGWENSRGGFFYSAPEIIVRGFSYSYPADVYSLGLVLWYMSHAGRRPTGSGDHSKKNSEFAFKLAIRQKGCKYVFDENGDKVNNDKEESDEEENDEEVQPNPRKKQPKKYYPANDFPPTKESDCHETIRDDLDGDLAALIRRCWVINPDKRPTMAEVENELRNSIKE